MKRKKAEKIQAREELPETCFKAAEVARMLNCSLVTVRRYTRNKMLPHIRIGRTLRYPRTELLAFLKKLGNG